MVRAAVARELFVSRNLNTTVAALTEGGVPVLVTKGSALAYTVYQASLAAAAGRHRPARAPDGRGSSRADPAELRLLRSAALSTGELVSHQIAFERTDANDVRHVIDLHWKIVNPQVLADTMSFDDLCRDAGPALALGPARPGAVGDRQPGAWLRPPAGSPPGARSPGLAVRLQAARGGIERRGLADVPAVCLPPPDRRPLSGRPARRPFTTRRPVAGGSRAGARRGGPEQNHRGCYLDGPVRKRDVLMSDLKVLGSWSERMRLMREHAFPPAAFIQQRYGTQARWLLPALYRPPVDHRCCPVGSIVMEQVISTCCAAAGSSAGGEACARRCARGNRPRALVAAVGRCSHW